MCRAFMPPVGPVLTLSYSLYYAGSVQCYKSDVTIGAAYRTGELNGSVSDRGVDRPVQ